MFRKFIYIICILLICTSCNQTINSNSISNTIDNTSNNDLISSNIEKSETSVSNITNIQLSFVGDCMLAAYKDEQKINNFNDYVKRYGTDYFLDKVKSIFENDDYTLVNLENVLTDNVVNPIKKNHSPAYWYKSKISNINILINSGINGASIANNHINDYGPVGKQDTINTIKNSGLDLGEEGKIIYFTKDNFTMSFICHGLWGSWETSSIISIVNKAKENSDFQIVYFHGGKEKIHEPEEWKRKACKQLIDNGADLVIGAHPHVLQPIETYKGKQIVYSLGNFCYGGSRKPENKTIIYQYNIKVDNNKNIIEENQSIIPCYVYTGEINNFQPAIIEKEEDKQEILNFMYNTYK